MTTFDTAGTRTATTAPSTGFGVNRLADALRAAGTHATRYGLVLILLWIGGMKFTAYEAEGVKPLVERSPLYAELARTQLLV